MIRPRYLILHLKTASELKSTVLVYKSLYTPHGIVIVCNLHQAEKKVK